MTHTIEKETKELASALVITKITFNGMDKTLSDVKEAASKVSTVSRFFKIEIERAIDNVEELIYNYSVDESEYYERIKIFEEDNQYFIKDTYRELSRNIDENEAYYLNGQLEHYLRTSQELNELKKQLQEIENIITNIKRKIEILKRIIN